MLTRPHRALSRALLVVILAFGLLVAGALAASASPGKEKDKDAGPAAAQSEAPGKRSDHAESAKAQAGKGQSAGQEHASTQGESEAAPAAQEQRAHAKPAPAPQGPPAQSAPARQSQQTPAAGPAPQRESAGAPAGNGTDAQPSRSSATTTAKASSEGASSKPAVRSEGDAGQGCNGSTSVHASIDDNRVTVSSTGCALSNFTVVLCDGTTFKVELDGRSTSHTFTVPGPVAEVWVKAGSNSTDAPGKGTLANSFDCDAEAPLTGGDTGCPADMVTGDDGECVAASAEAPSLCDAPMVPDAGDWCDEEEPAKGKAVVVGDPIAPVREVDLQTPGAPQGPALPAEAAAVDVTEVLSAGVVAPGGQMVASGGAVTPLVGGADAPAQAAPAALAATGSGPLLPLAAALLALLAGLALLRRTRGVTAGR